MRSESRGGSAALIHLACFGGLQVTAETPLGPGFLEPRQVAVLAVLAAAGMAGVPEERLLELLWGDAPDESARLAHAQALAALRRNGNGGALITGTAVVALNSARVASDVARFVAACKGGDAEGVRASYAGPFLQGAEIEAGPRFEAWVAETRERFAREYDEALRSTRGGAPPLSERPPTAAPNSIEPMDVEAPRRTRVWITVSVLAVLAIIAAVAMLRRTGPHRAGEEAVARGSQLWRDGKTVSATVILDSVVAKHPEDPEASQLLGEIIFRSGPTIGQSAVASRAAFERAVRLDPVFVDGWERLLRVGLIARDSAGAERAWVGLRQAMGPRADTAYGWLRSTWTADSIPLQAELRRAATMPSAMLLEHAAVLGFEAGRTTEALALTEPLLGEQIAAPVRIHARSLRAALFGAVGDWARVDAEAVMLSHDWPWGGLMVAVAAALAPTRVVTLVALHNVRDRVMRVSPDTAAVAGTEAGILPPASRTLRLYLLGELAARLNDNRGVQAAVDSLASPKLRELTLPRRGGSYALALQAWQLAARGDTAAALARLEHSVMPVPLWAQRMLWVGGSLERRRRVLLLEATGRHAEAAGWAATVGEFPADLLLGPVPR